MMRDDDTSVLGHSPRLWATLNQAVADVEVGYDRLAGNCSEYWDLSVFTNIQGFQNDRVAAHRAACLQYEWIDPKHCRADG